MSGPLEGLRILDLCRLLPGGYATALLGDLGAEVIKVEQPGGGDPMRDYAPRLGDSSAYSWVADRNKRSIVVDLRDPAGREVVRRISRSADAAIESFRPRVAERLGVGPGDLRRDHPELVYCSLSGYGATGPLVDTPGHDINYAGRAGALSVIGVEGRPAVPGVLIADLAGGALVALAGLMAALWHAQRTGEGDELDISMTDGTFALHSIYLGGMFAGGPILRPGEDVITGASPCYNVYECADGRWLTVGALEPKFWTGLCEAVGRPDLLDTQADPDALPVWRELFASRDRDDWLRQLEAADVCVGPVNDLAEAAADPQLRARGMVAELSHPELGVMPQVGNPVRLAERPGAVRSAAPALGADTRALLAESGYADDEVESLIRDGIVEAQDN